MKSRITAGALSAIVLLGWAAAPANAAGDIERTTRSDGRLRAAAPVADPVTFTSKAGEPLAADKFLPDGVAASQPRSEMQKHAINTDFWIYDADTAVYFDYDHDGYFSGLDVTFDADTVHIAADVYARLYLSLDGGPWILYYTTDVFTLVGSSGDDDYLVETDLIDGYPSGYYDLLIELYDYAYDEHVASFGPVESAALSVLPLEDEYRDGGQVAPAVPPVSHSSGGGGSAGIVTLLMLASLLSLRRLRVRTTRPVALGSAQRMTPDDGDI